MPINILYFDDFVFWKMKDLLYVLYKLFFSYYLVVPYINTDIDVQYLAI